MSSLHQKVRRGTIVRYRLCLLRLVTTWLYTTVRERPEAELLCLMLVTSPVWHALLYALQCRCYHSREIPVARFLGHNHNLAAG